MDRLDKIIAEHSRYSRREAADLIRRGRVTVNGAAVRDGAAKFDPETILLTVEGIALPLRQHHTLMLNKPASYVSATEDPREKTVLELIREEDRYPELFPAGRLDKDTTGLLILTSDGDLCHRIISPRKPQQPVPHAAAHKERRIPRRIQPRQGLQGRTRNDTAALILHFAFCILHSAGLCLGRATADSPHRPAHRAARPALTISCKDRRMPSMA